MWKSTYHQWIQHFQVLKKSQWTYIVNLKMTFRGLCNLFLGLVLQCQYESLAQSPRCSIISGLDLSLRFELGSDSHFH